MVDRPILFSAPMVRALLAGNKTQTRRIIKKQAALDAVAVFGPKFLRLPGNLDLCRFAVGDRIWVREAHYLTDDGGTEYAIPAADDEEVKAHLDEVAELQRRWPAIDWSRHLKLRPSIHMPRWASRLTLTVTNVRVQRLQDISEEDALAEGSGRLTTSTPKLGPSITAKQGFQQIWSAIHGPGTWDANPWIAAYSFTVQHGNIDQLRHD